MSKVKFDLVNNINEREIIMNEERLDILDKVKELVFMKGTEYMTTEMVANYYNVPEGTIRTAIRRNKEELIKNGFNKYSKDEILRMFHCETNVKQERTRCIIVIDGEEIIINNTGLNLFNKRSVLNIGMLLEGSPIAEEVRTLLLDNHEQLNNIHSKLENGEEIIKEDIDKSNPLYFENKEEELRKQEKDLNISLVEAINTGDMNKYMAIDCQKNKIKEDLIALEKERNDLLVHSNKTYTASELATECGFKSANAFNKDLHERKIQYKVNGTWKLYSEYDGKGYTETKQTEKNGITIYNTRWTGEGRKFLLENVYNKNKTA